MPPSGVFDGTRAPTERILCVDDDPALCALLARRLATLGYSTATATSAADALSVLSSPGGIAGVFAKPPRFEELATRLGHALSLLECAHDRRSA
jgi:ActR/RegA family two-component response regulator